MVGLIFILPFFGLFCRVLGTTYIRLKSEIFDQDWRRRFWTLALIGSMLGIWSGFLLHYHPAAKFELVGFPFPLEIIRTESGQRVSSPVPGLVRCAAGTTNLVFAAMFLSLPVSIASYLKDWKRGNPAPPPP